MKPVVLTAATVLLVASASMRPTAQQLPKAPRFEVDPKWPSIPNNWVLGEVTSISVDRRDHIWVLHVPQSIPDAQCANAAPPRRPRRDEEHDGLIPRRPLSRKPLVTKGNHDEHDGHDDDFGAVARNTRQGIMRARFCLAISE